MIVESLLQKAADKINDAINRSISETDELRTRRREKEKLLESITGKVSGQSRSECHTLRFDRKATHKAVLLVTTPVEFGDVKLSKSVHKLVASHVGMSMDCVSHWALCVVDRGFGTCYCHDLMSDQLALNMLGKNYFRTYEATPDTVGLWSSCFYLGETSKSHEEIQNVGAEYMSLRPRYNLLSNNCQNLVEKMVKDICDGKLITQWKLSDELARAAPKIGLYVMIARLAADVLDKEKPIDSASVIRDIKFIKGLWDLDKQRSSK